eukprot:GILJ01011430.1.p1 GENE.GILJ01011430.1~~GILJ01011430.1.p1  ORF type:complete len:249 (-),score=12.87 GILJ01011430.1:87-833(-)
MTVEAAQDAEERVDEVPSVAEVAKTDVQPVWFKRAMKALMVPLMVTLALMTAAFAMDDWARASRVIDDNSIFKLKLFHPVLPSWYSETYFNYYTYLTERCRDGVCQYASQLGYAGDQTNRCLVIWRLFPLFLARAAGGLSIMVVLACTSILLCSVTIRYGDSTTFRKYGTLCLPLLFIVCVFAICFCFSELAIPAAGEFKSGISFKLFIAGTCGTVVTTVSLWALLLSTRTKRSVLQADISCADKGKM